MIISDGTTNLTFTGTMMDDALNPEQSSTKTSGGSWRTIRDGLRFVVIEKIRVTGTAYRTLLDLLNNGANDYFYTPTKTPDMMDATDFPMPVKIDPIKKSRQVGGGQKRYYLELKIESADKL